MSQKIYHITVERILTWHFRLRAEDADAAEDAAKALANESPENDNHLSVIASQLAKDQISQADNE